MLPDTVLAQESLRKLCPPTVDVLGFPFYAGNIDLFCAYFCKIIPQLTGSSVCISSSDSYSMVLSQRNDAYAKIMQRFWLNMPDGKPLAAIVRAQSHGAKQCRGADMMRALIRSTAHVGIKHFFCGCTPQVLNKLKEKAEKEWKNPHIVGVFSPPYQPTADTYDYAHIADIIKKSGAEIIWVALGVPKQHEFSVHLAKHIQVTAIFPVGAAFNFHTGAVTEAPNFVKKLGLEWFHRLLMEPRRLFVRYAYTIPWIVYYSLYARCVKRKNNT